MPTLSRRAGLPAAALLLALAAGCGSSDADTGTAAGDTGPAAAGDTGEQGGGKAGECDKLYGITFCMSYDLTGAVTASGRLAGTASDGTGPGPGTCEDWAKGAPGGDDGQRRLYLPSGGPYQPGDKFGGLTGNIIVPYTGPGTYPKKDLSGEGSPSGVITPDAEYTFILVGSSTGTATVNPDGSGSFTFDKLGTGQYGHPETVSGSVSWTCHNP